MSILCVFGPVACLAVVRSPRGFELGLCASPSLDAACCSPVPVLGRAGFIVRRVRADLAADSGERLVRRGGQLSKEDCLALFARRAVGFHLPFASAL